NYKISDKKLSSELNCDVIKIDGRTGKGIDDLILSIKRNIDSSISEGKKVRGHNNNSDKTELLSIYNEIDLIEHRVIEPILKNDVNKADLAKANSMLTVLDPSIKRELNKPDEITLRIDKILLHRFWGLLFFFLIMAVTFTSIFWVADPLMGLVDELFG